MKPLPASTQNEILDSYKHIMNSISHVQTKTAKYLENQRRDICKHLEAKVKEISRKISDEQAKAGETRADFKQREKELMENLETMTLIAQRIDNENRELISKNAELNIEFKSQEKDRELLIRQII